jgi:putative ABC transport system ATP-binding protein
MLLQITDVTKQYRASTATRPVLQGVTLSLRAGESVALTGESGSGKSTLLHLCGALDSFDSGEIALDGQRLSQLDETGRAALRRGSVALVFQQFNLIPALTVAQNLAFHARLAGREDTGWTATLTRRLGLSDLTARYPEQLSGGQQQRVAIGRALALRPRLLLADEPTGNLDETASDTVMDLMLALTRETKAALFMVTHSARLAARLDRQAHLHGGRIT